MDMISTSEMLEKSDNNYLSEHFCLAHKLLISLSGSYWLSNWVTSDKLMSEGKFVEAFEKA